jgi:hypothetical protein
VVAAEAAGADKASNSVTVIANIVTTDAAVATNADADNAVAGVVAEAAGDKTSNSAVSHAPHSHQSSPTAKP